MVLVTFREPREKLTSMFNVKFKLPVLAKKFIKEDAKFYAKQHGLKKWKLVNVAPEAEDYFKLVDGRGAVKIIYQYFTV